MSDSTALRRRLAQLEKELADLKSHVRSLQPEGQGLQPKGNWIDAITGSFQDDPEFDEILRLGQEVRNADKPMEK